jgi:hypothetical protein
MGLNHSPSIVTSGLVLALDAANPKSYPGSGTAWTDLSTSFNTATLTSPSIYDTTAGIKSFNFAITNYATLSANLVSSGSRTIVISFNTTDITNRSGVISNRDGTGGWFVCLNRNGGGNLTYSINNALSNNDLQATGVITQTNKWYIVAITHDENLDIGNIYLNGNLVVTTTLSDVLPIASLNSYVGREINSGQNMPGLIGFTFVYDRVLTAQEILQNYNALKGRYGL